MSREHYPCPCCGETTIDAGDHYLPACQCELNQKLTHLSEEVFTLVQQGADVGNVYDVLVDSIGDPQWKTITTTTKEERNHMNLETGRIHTEDEMKQMSAEEQAKMALIKRDLTIAERAQKQIDLYSPCGCGSGLKFKFCCHKSKQ